MRFQCEIVMIAFRISLNQYVFFPQLNGIIVAAYEVNDD